jgi:hypothetical protein
MAFKLRTLKEIEFATPGEVVEGRLLSVTPVKYRDGGVSAEYLIKRTDGVICTFKGSAMLNKLLSVSDVGLTIQVKYIGKDGAPVPDGMSPKKIFEVCVDEESTPQNRPAVDPGITDADIPF